MERQLELTIVDGSYAVCRLDPADEIPPWAMRGPFFSISRTAAELSVICAEENVPEEQKCTGGWRLIRFEGPFGFDETGVLLAVASPLAEQGISILAVSTWDTDHVLIPAVRLADAEAALLSAGHRLRREG
jgi:uncharacterized protein